ncbi:beta-lactamase-like protein [Fimicolochytrium jonesii]|uniref:beta-lactamase-like protein n=1 Tax=Fimicolochytrium jonesii TaxID=1396493 RepID=UPI0022FE607E|nr:beta-lactamase-like protein [Fimicolochytrium jonesii]KAI8820645.1 beta-lactamase-like protein [Fimicolochytrium jonesii]
MTAYVKFTPLSGARNEDPLCYLLEVDEAKILLDCGWSERFDPEDLVELRRVAKQVDAVLFSHGDIEHLGAYPYAFGHLGLNCPAYATFPVHDMGQITMYDAFQSRASAEEFSTFTLDHVDAAFDKMVTLRYSQPFSLSGKCNGITVTAYLAGHTVGGTIWKIKKDTDDIVYAVDYNHKKDRHLNGTVMMTTEALARPSILIADAYNAKNEQPLRKVRDSSLIDEITSALNNDANVLIPVDSSTRVLEIAYLLEQHWAFQRLQTPLLFLTHQSYRTMSMAKTMLEWMGDGVANAFSQRREAPFDFKFLRTVYRKAELDKLRGPKVVLASLGGVDTGWSHDILREWGSSEKALVLLPDRGLPGSMARKLYTEWSLHAPPKTEENTRSAVNLELTIPIIAKEKIPLEGEELTEFLSREQQRREHEAESLAKQRDLMEDDESDIDDDEGEVAEVANILASGYDIYVKDQTKAGGFFKQSQSYRMFPISEPRKRVDDYGEQIDPAVYMRGEYQYAMQQAEETEASRVQEPMELEKLRQEEDPIPFKFIAFESAIDVRCRVVYIDFEGRSDGRSIKNILPQVAPRKLILVRGSEESTQNLESYCLEAENLTNDVYSPHVGECINVSAATNIYQVRLTDSLVSSLKMTELADYQLAYVSGLVRFPETEVGVGSSGSEAMEIDIPSNARPASLGIPVLDVMPADMQQHHRPVIVGDVKLSEFRRLLQNEGLSTEFVSGVLMVRSAGKEKDADPVIVSRAMAGRLALEGSIGELYYRVRDLLYKQHALL